jgi:ribonucleoside-diphosphate reductase alpha chain
MDTILISNANAPPVWQKTVVPRPEDLPGKSTNLTPNALTVLKRRYLRKDAQGRVIESPEEIFRRVADAVAAAERIHDAEADVEAVADQFYEAMANLDFLPNSPTAMNAGTEIGQLSACFVLPVEDDMARIFDAVKATALIHQSGGGTGFSFSRLRPAGDVVRSTGGVASGPISFMRVFDTSTDVIKQGGRRRGANMGILRVDHPDIIEFITCKEQEGAFANFNISVAITDAFMQAVRADAEYDLLNPRTGQVVKSLKARAVFDKIVEMAWRNGEPGLIFIDRINASNPTPHVGEIESTNPCGEQPLLPYESCNLGSINLGHMVTVDGRIDYDKLGQTVDLAVRFLDDVIDVNRYPLPQIAEITRANRKIGLGVMGFADMLVQIGVPYDSSDGVRVAEEVMSFIQEQAHQASIALARERGPFPNFHGSALEKAGSPPIRNATLTTIAPTGSISIIADCSGGIEPYFALAFVRHVLDDDQLVEVIPLFEQVARAQSFYNPDLIQTVVERGGCQDVEGVPPDVQRIFFTAHDIAPDWHVRMQAAFQKYTDNAVSKTINFPNQATQADVRQAYLLAYELSCKGLTIYRDGSRQVQVLTKGTTEKAVGSSSDGRRSPRPRPTVTWGTTEKIPLGCGQTLYVTVNEDEQGLFEVFATMGKSGGCMSSHSEALGRLISLALRSGIDIQAVLRQLRGIRCPAPVWRNGTRILSCADAIGQAIEWYTKGKKSKPFDSAQDEPLDSAQDKPFDSTQDKPSPSVSKNIAGTCPECPECGSLLEFNEGCVICRACGYSQCS